MTLRSSALLSAFLLSASTLLSQTGFSTHIYPAAGDTVLRVADFNRDGRPDLLGLNPAFNQGNIYLNDGKGGFKAPVALPQSANNVGYIVAAKIADMNGDGAPDIVACYEEFFRQGTFATLDIFLNDGAGNFTVGQSFSLPNACQGMVVGDVNHDGHQDLVIATTTGGNGTPFNNLLQTFLGDGAGKVNTTPITQQNASYDAPAAGPATTNCIATDMTSGNFLLDGQLSLLIDTICYGPNNSNPGPVPSTTVLARGQGNGQFLFSPSHTAREQFGGLQTADVNQDGLPDATFYSIYNSPLSSNLVYARNTGSGGFSYSSLNNDILVGGAPQPLQFTGDAVADLTGDGINDVAAAYVTTIGTTTNPSANPYISILAGSKNGSLTDSQHFLVSPTASGIGDLVSADFNGDGKQDLAAFVNFGGSSYPTSSLYVYLNDGSTGAACPAPTTANKNVICTPAAGATVTGTSVTVTAASNVQSLTLNRLYLDSNPVYSSSQASINTPITVTSGFHTLVLVSYNTGNQSFTSSTNFTVPANNSSGCYPATGYGVSICSPVAGSTNPSSPSTVTLTAGAIAQSGNITAIRAYIDNVAVATVNNASLSNSFQISQPVNVAPGTHRLVVVGYQSNGGSVTKSETFTVTNAGPCAPPNGEQGVAICSPGGTATVTSPLTVSAGAYQLGGNIFSIRIYLDNVAEATIANPKSSTTFSITQSITAAPGKHNLVVVAYPNGGGSFTASETVTVQ